MPYNNLIYFIVVILVLTTSSIPEQPPFSLVNTLSLFLLKLFFFRLALNRIFYRIPISTAERYATAERQGSILAILVFTIDIYLLDSQYYFAKLPFTDNLPALISLAGLALFSLYLSLMWATAKNSYQKTFGRIQTIRSFVRANLRTNLPIILPWLFLSFIADLLHLAPFPVVHKVLLSPWGEPIMFFLFFSIMIIIFPALITRLWKCTPLPPGPVRERIEVFCANHNVGYKEIMIWPLFEGQALTAGVMGLIKKFRYLLITPALIKALTPEELEAVIAHEVGHVKKRHLPLYLFIFLGFGLLSQLLTTPFLSIISNSDLFYKLIYFTDKEPENALVFASTVPMFLLMLIYFRYVMGFFMRNFERQADLYALQAMRSSTPIIRVFEKISWLSGNTRDLPCWHHFSISQRIDFLKNCTLNPHLIPQHDRKVRLSLLGLLLLFSVSTFLVWNSPGGQFTGESREKFAEAVIINKIRHSPQDYALHQLLGDLQYSRKRYPETIKAYEQCLELAPDNYEVLNNLAWLHLTAEDPSLRIPTKALELARKASIYNQSPYILDTLALAFWQNGYPERAVATIQKAIAQNPQKIAYYQMQLDKFLTLPVPTKH